MIGLTTRSMNSTLKTGLTRTSTNSTGAATTVDDPAGDDLDTEDLVADDEVAALITDTTTSPT